ncbi:MAG: tetratricopeptide repeat protein [Ignavibacteriaceae bacterium]|nr:tetratricopeptide repeat protein [Ignavibacteriaceae bacterium]
MNKILLMVFIFSFSLFAQQMRSLNNDGVELYKEGKYSEAEVNFKKGVEKQPENFAANFNLGDSYYKQGRYDEAIKSYETALKTSKENEYSAKTYHNVGNSLLKMQEKVQDPQQKNKMLQQSIEAYKNSLKLNPDDRETKYNLSYALSLLDKNKNKQQQDNKDKNNKDDQKKDQQDKEKQNQDKNNQDKNNQQNKDEQKPDQNQESKQDNLKQPDKNKISKEEAERILQALKNNEKDLQKKLRKVQGKKVKTEKDW